MSLVAERPQLWGRILTRISRDDGDRGAGVKRQAREVAMEFDRLGIGYDMEETIWDNDVSAQVKDRKSYVQALESIASGRWQVIGLWELKRLSRDLGEFYNDLLPALARAKVRVVTTDAGEFDFRTSTAMTNFLAAGLKGVEEKATMSWRSSKFHAAAADGGRPAGGPPYGYRAIRDEDGANWEIVREEADIVARDVERLLAGTSFRSILREWQERKVLTRRGHFWRHQTLRRYFMNPALAGLRHHFIREVNPAEQTKKGGKVVGEMLTPASWPGIITVDQHDRLVALFSERNRDPGRQRVASSIPAEREEARAAKDFERADEIRDRLAELGWTVRDAAEGPSLVPLAPKS